MTSLPSDPTAPLWHRFSSAAGEHVLVIPYSRIFDLPQEFADSLDADHDGAGSLIRALARPTDGEVSLDEIPEPNPQNLSLNVSASCNLTCSYCYASRGSFAGAQPASMSWPTAKAAIDQLLQGAASERPVTIGFLGGEPFVNRRLIHQCVDYSADEAARRNLDVRFSVTTNGTLLQVDDIALLRSHPFAVTVSLDGGEALQNRQRPRSGSHKGTWLSVIENLADLLESPGHAHLSARATVSRFAFGLRERLDVLGTLGFPEVGFSPLRVAQEEAGPLRDVDWSVYLASLIDAAKGEIERARHGQPIRLTNLLIAMRQIQVGASSPYPCGAGGGYFSVASDGRWYACHRAIGNPAYELGDSEGLDVERRRQFIAARHVHAQTDCRTCWARYLCSGGCHQEASARTQASCDFIRGWLTFALQTYCECGPELLQAGRVRTVGRSTGVIA